MKGQRKPSASFTDSYGKLLAQYHERAVSSLSSKSLIVKKLAAFKEVVKSFEHANQNEVKEVFETLIRGVKSRDTDVKTVSFVLLKHLIGSEQLSEIYGSSLFSGDSLTITSQADFYIGPIEEWVKSHVYLLGDTHEES